MKKTILSLLFVVLSAYTMFGAISSVQDSVAAKTNSAIAEIRDITPVPSAHGDHYHAQIDVDNEVPNIAYVIPIAFFVFVLVIIGLSQYYGHKRTRMQTDLYMEYLKQGKEIPEKLMVRQKDVSSNLKRGIILMSVGLGVCIFLFAQNTNGTEWTMGVIPFLIGVGYLIVYRLSKNSEAKAND